MHFSTASSLAIALIGISATAMPTEDITFIEGKRAPDHFVFMDITNGIPEGPPVNMTTTDSDLQTRRVIDYCIRSDSSAGVCIALGALLNSVAQNIASQLKGDSDNNDCTTHRASFDNVHWKVHATGRNCDTTAQFVTIQGAIDNYLRSQDEKVCGVHCIKLSHGGTYTGYVTLAPSGMDLDTYYCGASNAFGQCGSGGKKDAHN